MGSVFSGPVPADPQHMLQKLTGGKVGSHSHVGTAVDTGKGHIFGIAAGKDDHITQTGDHGVFGDEHFRVDTVFLSDFGVAHHEGGAALVLAFGDGGGGTAHSHLEVFGKLFGGEPGNIVGLIGDHDGKEDLPILHKFQSTFDGLGSVFSCKTFGESGSLLFFHFGGKAFGGGVIKFADADLFQLPRSDGLALLGE